jgi:hypothetical protein
MQIPGFPATFVEESIFSPSYALGAFVKNQVGIAAWIHISGSSILFYWFSCLFLCQYHAVFIDTAL